MSVYNAGQIFGVERAFTLIKEEADSECEEKDKTSADLLNRKKKKTKKRLRLGPNTFHEGRWTIEEHRKFLESCKIYKNNWRQVNIKFLIFLLFSGSKRCAYKIICANPFSCSKICV